MYWGTATQSHFEHLQVIVIIKSMIKERITGWSPTGFDSSTIGFAKDRSGLRTITINDVNRQKPTVASFADAFRILGYVAEEWNSLNVVFREQALKGTQERVRLDLEQGKIAPQVAAEKEAAIAYLTEHVREAAPVPAAPTEEQGGQLHLKKPPLRHLKNHLPKTKTELT